MRDMFLYDFHFPFMFHLINNKINYYVFGLLFVVWIYLIHITIKN